MARQWLIPEYGFIDEDGVEEYLLPEYGFINEDQVSGAVTTATLPGVGGLQAIGSVPALATATLPGVGALQATGNVLVVAAVTLAGVGDLQADGNALVTASSTLTGVGGLQADGSIPGAAATLTGFGGFQADGNAAIPPRASLPGVGGFQAIGNALVVSEATLTGVGGFQATATREVEGFEQPVEGVLVCDTNLDKPDDVTVPVDAGDPDFGAYVGQSIWVPPTDSSIPSYTVGTSDLSIEMIILPREGDVSGASDFPTIAGLCDGTTSSGDVVVGCTNIVGNLNVVRFIWQVGGPIRAVDISPFKERSFWTHLCCNFSRSGDMELFDNGVSVGTSDISGDVANNVGSNGIYPMTSPSSIAGISDDLGDNPSGLILPWYSPLAGYAIHSRVLTPGEIAANNAALNTGDYPETEVCYNFRTFVDGLGARVVPPGDTNLDHISVSNKWTVPPIPYGAELFSPEGANDTLHIEDLSGNGRHFGLQTLASYDDTEVANRGKVSFTITGRDFRT